jgi:large subunit ribosomal protein L29
LKAVDIRNMTEKEIEESVRGLKEKLFKHRAEKVSGRVERPQQLTELKKDLARCYTILKEKQSGK